MEGEFNAQKLVTRTVIWTLVAVFGVLVLTFFVLFAFSPATLGNLFDNMGNYSAKIYFYERQYNKTSSIEDLYTLVINLDYDKDYNKTFNYANTLVGKEGFTDFCAEEDKKLNTSNVEITTAEYCYIQLVTAAYNKDGIDSAINECKRAVKFCG